jgi:hypothetical protein
MTIPDPLPNVVNGRLENLKLCQPRQDTGENIASGITVLYRRLPSFTVGSRILFLPFIPSSFTPLFLLSFIQNIAHDFSRR